ncbi:MAG: hypothetical protein ACFE9C_00020 [Candidatus Hodarchaeota archaeon]
MENVDEKRMTNACKLFGIDFPVFYNAEYTSEKREKKIKEDMGKHLKEFFLRHLFIDAFTSIFIKDTFAEIHKERKN